MTAGYEIGREGPFGGAVPPIPLPDALDRSHSFNPRHQPGRRFSFTGPGGDFAALLLRGALLTVPTFGFYRFWFLTDMRRHLWGNTVVDGERFEYTGTARELLVGFLMALAILAPVYIGYAILGLVAERAQAFASVPLFLLLYAFGQFAVFRARRYRLTRTSFRGLRFWMEGSGWSYAGRAALWDLATVATLGAAYPWRTAALERYKMQCSRYGSLEGDFVGRGGDLFRAGFWVVPLCLVLMMAYVVAALQAGSWRQAQAALGVLPLMLVAMSLLYPWLMAVQARWSMAGLRFGPVALASELRAGQLYGCYVKLVAMGLLASAVAGILVVAAFFSLSPGQFRGGSPAEIAGALGVMGIVYLAYFLTLGALRRYFLTRGFWVEIASTAMLVNGEALDAARAAGRAESSVGEGLADALDVGAF